MDKKRGTHLYPMPRMSAPVFIPLLLLIGYLRQIALLMRVLFMHPGSSGTFHYNFDFYRCITSFLIILFYIQKWPSYVTFIFSRPA